MSDMRQKILLAARKRFRHYGLKKPNMREIGADVGVAIDTLYRYFKNKDGIILAFIDLFKERHQRAVEKIINSNAPANEKLRNYMLERFRASEATRKGAPHVAEITVVSSMSRRIPSVTRLERAGRHGRTVTTSLCDNLHITACQSVRLSHTSVVARNNLTCRQCNGRLSRKVLSFSKDLT